MGALWLASFSRWAPALAYVISIAIIAWVMHLRPIQTPPSPPQASKALAKNHKIKLDDLQIDATKALVGKYLVREIAAGQPIPPDAVADKPSKGKSALSKP